MKFLNADDSPERRKLNEQIRAESIIRANMELEIPGSYDGVYNTDSDYDEIQRPKTQFDRLLEQRDRLDEQEFEAKKAAALKQLEDYNV